VKSEYLIINATMMISLNFIKLKQKSIKYCRQNIDPGANLTAAVAAYNQLMFEEDLGQQYKYT
jgi:hypothetical protein